MKPAPPVMINACNLDSCSLRILQGELQLLGERVDGGSATLPLPLGFETQIADAAAPRRQHPADGAEIAAVGVLLIETANHVRRDPDEGPQRRRRLDAVLAPVPGAAEHQRDLLEIIDE